MSKTALLFSGQGAQAVGMGRDLAEAFPEIMDRVPDPEAILGYDLKSICFAGPESTLTETQNAQPGIFFASWVAFQALRSQVPDLQYQATAGLSLGEFTALAAADALPPETAFRLVHQRGRFMQQACEATQGTMAAVLGLEQAAVEAICQESDVEIANLNCPGQIVISGATEAVQHACPLAKTKGAKRALPLNVAGAYHSRLMADAAEQLQTILAEIPFEQPKVDVISNVTAQPHTDPESIRSLLVRQVTSTVRWEASMRYLLDQGFDRFIELGPGSTLTGFLKRMTSKVTLLQVHDTESLKTTVHAL